VAFVVKPIQDGLLFLRPIERGRDRLTENHLRQLAAEPAWQHQRAMGRRLKTWASIPSRHNLSCPGGLSSE